MEGLPFYRDKLHEEVVFARFQEVLNKVKRRFSSPSLSVLSRNNNT
jgi:condensin complex subunit 1